MNLNDKVSSISDFMTAIGLHDHEVMIKARFFVITALIIGIIVIILERS